MFVEKVKFCYSSLSNRVPSCDMLMKITLVEIIIYGMSQNLQQVSVKKRKSCKSHFQNRGLTWCTEN